MFLYVNVIVIMTLTSTGWYYSRKSCAKKFKLRELIAGPLACQASLRPGITAEGLSSKISN